MGLERARRAAVASGLALKWISPPKSNFEVETPVATEEADHAQIEGSFAASFARIEPASDRAQLLDFTEHRP